MVAEEGPFSLFYDHRTGEAGISQIYHLRNKGPFSHYGGRNLNGPSSSALFGIVGMGINPSRTSIVSEWRGEDALLAHLWSQKSKHSLFSPTVLSFIRHGEQQKTTVGSLDMVITKHGAGPEGEEASNKPTSCAQVWVVHIYGGK